jgi:hypothetical protein
MAGPGSRKMGGAGIKAGRPPTPMAGSGIGAPKGGPAAAMGAPPMAPKVANVRPPGLGAGAPPPMPGGGAGPPPPPAGGMGGSGGFERGGRVDTELKRPPPDEGPSNMALKRPPDEGPSSSALKGQDDPAAETALKSGYAKGGSVGGDTKARHKGTIHKHGRG